MSLTSLKLLFWDVLVVQALPVTLQLIAGSFVMACIIGLIGGIIRGLKVPVLSQILGIYVQLCRGIPDCSSWNLTDSGCLYHGDHQRWYSFC